MKKLPWNFCKNLSKSGTNSKGGYLSVKKHQKIIFSTIVKMFVLNTLVLFFYLFLRPRPRGIASTEAITLPGTYLEIPCTLHLPNNQKRERVTLTYPSGEIFNTDIYLRTDLMKIKSQEFALEETLCILEVPPQKLAQFAQKRSGKPRVYPYFKKKKNLKRKQIKEINY